MAPVAPWSLFYLFGNLDKSPVKSLAPQPGAPCPSNMEWWVGQQWPAQRGKGADHLEMVLTSPMKINTSILLLFTETQSKELLSLVGTSHVSQ